jgi:tetratricopeptide (TPR) repeat protein
MDSLRAQLEKALGQTYRIERELGGGGMSRVFLATETAFERDVVLKVLPPDLAGSVSSERFKREIATAARLQHAHIVPLLSAGDANGLPWFSMPYVEGETLRGRLKHGELPVGDAVRILRDIASALAYAHARGVVHRDIKPENVLLAEGAASVSDFGVAKALADAAAPGGTLTSVGVALGTPAYMAPEQATADTRTDHRADLYALGVIAYEMLAGHNPFGGRSPQATLAAHLTETPAPIESVRTATPPALARLVRRCLAKSAADRPQSATEVVQELDAIATPSGGTQPMSAASGVAFPGVGSVARIAAWSTRRRIAVGLAAAGVLAASAWGVTLVARGPDLDARTVAVLPFEVITGDTAVIQAARVAADWLMQGILQTDSANVVSSAMVNFAIAAEDAGAEDVVSRVARVTGAGTILTGSASRFGDSLRFQVSIVNASTGRVIRAIEPVSGPIGDPLIAINALRDRVLGSIVSGDAARQVAISGQPPSYAAYKEYIKGREVWLQRDEAGAVIHFQRAIALDSTFAIPYNWIAARWMNVGRRDSADATMARIERFRDRLSATDLVGVEWGRAMVTGDLATYLRTGQEYARRNDEQFIRTEFAGAAVQMLRLDIAIPALEADDSIAALLKVEGVMWVLVDAYHLAGDHRREGEYIELARRRYPNNVDWLGRRLRHLAAAGRPAEALALADTVLRSQADPTAIGGLNALSAASWEFEAHGDNPTAQRLTEMGLRWAAEHKPARVSFEWDRSVGRAWLDLGNTDSAMVHLQAALPDTTTRGTIGYIGLAHVLRGDSTRARAIADSLGDLTEQYPTGIYPYWRAAILARLGDKDRALQLFKVAHQQGASMQNWHYLPALRSLRGYPPFDALITPVK